MLCAVIQFRVQHCKNFVQNTDFIFQILICLSFIFLKHNIRVLNLEITWEVAFWICLNTKIEEPLVKRFQNYVLMYGIFWKQYPKRQHLPDAAFIRCEQVKKYILLHCSLPIHQKNQLEASVNICFSAVGFLWYDHISELCYGTVFCMSFIVKECL